MNERDLTVSENIMALARRRKKGGKKSKRSLMLKMVMPMLSRENGDRLADAIKANNSGEFKRVWDDIKGQLSEQLESNKATASSSSFDIDEIDSLFDMY